MTMMMRDKSTVIVGQLVIDVGGQQHLLLLYLVVA